MERFWGRVDRRGPDECWLWTGGLSSGYGRIWIDGRVEYAHRVSLWLAGQDVPAGLQLDHLCRVRRCVNPAHLEVVTQAENILRGVPHRAAGHNARKTHCPQGHEYDEANTYIDRSGRRHCRTCGRETARRLYHRQKAG